MEAAVLKEWILKLLAAILESIFLVCGWLQTDVWQCPFSLEIWNELIVGPCQIILGLVIDLNEMTVRILDEYLNEVRTLINMKWNPKKRFFHVKEVQKLVGKLAHLSKAAPWIYKLMLHLYTSLAFTLRKNKELLTKSLPGFRLLCSQIEKKQFNINHSILQREVCYAMKQAAKMVSYHKVVYQVNKTMQKELNLLAQALSASPNIEFVMPIAFLIPRTPSASIF
jgi:hypothetical protein